MNESHMLTIINESCADCGDAHTCEACVEPWGPEQAFTITCPGVSDGCRAWRTCSVCPDPMTDDQDEALYETGEAHGVDHQRLDGEWMVPAAACFVKTNDDIADAVDDLKPLAAGTYPVDFTVEDETSVRLSLASQEVTADAVRVTVSGEVSSDNKQGREAHGLRPKLSTKPTRSGSPAKPATTGGSRSSACAAGAAPISARASLMAVVSATTASGALTAPLKV